MRFVDPFRMLLAVVSQLALELKALPRQQQRIRCIVPSESCACFACLRMKRKDVQTRAQPGGNLIWKTFQDLLIDQSSAGPTWT